VGCGGGPAAPDAIELAVGLAPFLPMSAAIDFLQDRQLRNR
jgi:hypothetical protein